MKLEPGEEYITTGGATARILWSDGPGDSYIGEIKGENGEWHPTSWNKYGEHGPPGHPSPFDLLRLSPDQKLRMELRELVDELCEKPWHFQTLKRAADRIEALLKSHTGSGSE